MIDILSTGDFPADLLSYARERNTLVTVEPFIRTEETITPAVQEQINSLSQKNLIVIFTSKKAVRAVRSALTSPPDWQFFCIDGATYQEVISFWDAASVVDVAPYGIDLARKIANHPTDKERVFFCGNRRLDTIPDYLKARDIPLQEMVVYQTIETPRPIDKVYDAILFYSPSAIHSFFSQNQIHSSVLCCIGETTAKALKQYPTQHCPILISPKADKREMIDLVINHLNQNI